MSEEGVYQEDWGAHGSAPKAEREQGADEADFDEHVKGQVRTQERKDLWEAWAGFRREKCKGKQGSST